MPEEQIATISPDAMELTTEAETVTRERVFADGDGLEKAVVTAHPTAGASSEAAPESGIPSAVTQHAAAGNGPRAATTDEDETPMGDRDIPARQNVQP